MVKSRKMHILYSLMIPMKMIIIDDGIFPQVFLVLMMCQIETANMVLFIKLNFTFGHNKIYNLILAVYCYFSIFYY